MKLQCVALVFLGVAVLAAAQERPGRGGRGRGDRGGRGGRNRVSLSERLEALINSTYTDGIIPQEVQDLRANGSDSALRQALDIVREDAFERKVRDLVASTFPTNVPAEVTELLNNGSRQALRQVLRIVELARLEQQLREAAALAFPNGLPENLTALLNNGSRQALNEARRLLRPQLFQLQVQRDVANAFPNGVPPAIQELLNNGSSSALRQAQSAARSARRVASFVARIEAAGGTVSQEVRDLIATGTPESLRSAEQLLRQQLPSSGSRGGGSRGNGHRNGHGA